VGREMQRMQDNAFEAPGEWDPTTQKAHLAQYANTTKQRILSVWFQMYVSKTYQSFFTSGLLVFLSWLHVFSYVSSPSEEQLLSARHAGSLCTCPCFFEDSPLLTQTCVITQQRIQAPASTLPSPLASLPLQF